MPIKTRPKTRQVPRWHTPLDEAAPHPDPAFWETVLPARKHEPVSEPLPIDPRAPQNGVRDPEPVPRPVASIEEVLARSAALAELRSPRGLLRFYSRMLAARPHFSPVALGIGFTIIRHIIEGKDPAISAGTLAAELGRTKPEIVRATQELRNRGWWSVDRTGRAGRGGRINMFAPLLPETPDPHGGLRTYLASTPKQLGPDKVARGSSQDLPRLDPKDFERLSPPSKG